LLPLGGSSGPQSRDTPSAARKAPGPKLPARATLLWAALEATPVSRQAQAGDAEAPSGSQPPHIRLAEPSSAPTPPSRPSATDHPRRRSRLPLDKPPLHISSGRGVSARTEQTRGQITSALSAGTNALLRQGATPATHADDVLAALGLEREPVAKGVSDDPGAAAVVAAIEGGAGTLDEIVRVTGLGAGDLAATPALLELEGLVAVDEGVVRSTIAR